MKLFEIISDLPDYSKHSTELLHTMLKPGVLHRDEKKYKVFIRRELKKREKDQAK